MTLWQRPLAALALALLATHAGAQQVSERLTIAGAVKTPLTFDVAQLRAFAPEHVASATVMRRGDGKDTASTVRGVRLTALLERAALAGGGHNDWKHTVVLATATDGYQVAFSWPELFNTDVGSAVLVVFERDGQPLADREGRIALVSARDLQTGPRSVRWLQRLDVKLLTD